MWWVGGKWEVGNRFGDVLFSRAMGGRTKGGRVDLLGFGQVPRGKFPGWAIGWLIRVRYGVLAWPSRLVVVANLRDGGMEE